MTSNKTGAGKKTKVLIADDNTDFRENLKDITERLGYEVATAADGIEAVKQAEEKKPDVIIMDIRMPGMDGVEALAGIKKILPKTPVVLITAYAADEEIDKALRDGAFGYLRKPLDFDDFVGVLENAKMGGRLVLIVDDNKELTASMKDILDDRGYHTEIANNGGAAIIKSQQNNFDIILLDIKMPYFNGPAAYREIRSIRPDAVVIVITGLGAEGAKAAKEVVEQSAYAWMEKPVDMNKLLTLMERIKEQKASGKLTKPGNDSQIP